MYLKHCLLEHMLVIIQTSIIYNVSDTLPIRIHAGYYTILCVFENEI